MGLPSHRLLSSKYNPARIFTGEGTMGIDSMYMCIYGMIRAVRCKIS